MAKERRFGTAAVALSGALILPGSALAAVITPDSYSATIGLGETISVDKTITTDAGGATRVDVFFLADNTGSMGSIISTAQSRASDILNASAFSGLDIGFGVGRYLGDPSEAGDDQFSAYDVLQTVTTDKVSTQTAINNWYASGGGDFPEANLYALHQAATNGAPEDGGLSAGEPTGWRSGSQRIVAWFGDATGHQSTVDLPEAIAALVDAGVTVVGFNSQSSGAGIDGVYDGGIDSRNQASAIATETGGSLLNDFTTLSSDDFVSAVVDEITGAASTIDLIFETSGDTSGLDIAFTCTDALGCNDVPGGESRSFRMDVTGIAEGDYAFSVFARGVDALENDHIIVSSATTAVPEPDSLSLVLLGVGVLGASAFRRRKTR